MVNQDSNGGPHTNIGKSAGNADRDYEQYLSHRDRLLAGLQHYARGYDKWLLTLSGGALALSMTLCKDVVVGAPQGTGWLLASWLLFGAAILSILSGTLLCQGAHEKDIEILDRLYREHKEHWQTEVSTECRKHWRSTAGGPLNKLSLVCFTTGLCFLAIFASQNMETMEIGRSNDKKQETSGRVEDMMIGKAVNKDPDRIIPFSEPPPPMPVSPVERP